MHRYKVQGGISTWYAYMTYHTRIWHIICVYDISYAYMKVRGRISALHSVISTQSIRVYDISCAYMTYHARIWRYGDAFQNFIVSSQRNQAHRVFAGHRRDFVVLSKETCQFQKRPANFKRDLPISKETCQFQKRLYQFQKRLDSKTCYVSFDILGLFWYLLGLFWQC